MAEGARLESVYMATYRGFESLPLCKLPKTVNPDGFFLGVPLRVGLRLPLFFWAEKRPKKRSSAFALTQASERHFCLATRFDFKKHFYFE